jgi:hypothetical protein
MVALSTLWLGSPDGQLRRTETGVLPAFVAERGESADRTRTLVLSAPDESAVEYTLVTGSGPVLGDGDVRPPLEDAATLDRAVADLVGGVGGDEISLLRRSAVAYILAPADSAVADALDRNPYLDHLSSSDGTALWEVSGFTTRARSVGRGWMAPLPAVPVDGDAALGTLVSTDIPVDEDPGRVQVAVTAEEGWTASLDGAAVAPETAGGLVMVPVPGGQAGSAFLTVAFDQQPRNTALLVPLIALLLVGVMLVPAARSEPLLDPDEDVSLPGAPQGGDAAPAVDSVLAVPDEVAEPSQPGRRSEPEVVR